MHLPIRAVFSKSINFLAVAMILLQQNGDARTLKSMHLLGCAALLLLTTEARVLKGTGGPVGAGGARRPPEVHLAEDNIPRRAVVAGVQLLPPPVLPEHREATADARRVPPHHLRVVPRLQREPGGETTEAMKGEVTVGRLGADIPCVV